MPQAVAMSRQSRRPHHRQRRRAHRRAGHAGRGRAGSARPAAPALVLTLVLVVAGCGGDTATETASTAAATASPAATGPATPADAEGPTDVTTTWVFDRALVPSDGAWAAPYGVDVESDGTVWVADTGNHRVVGLHPDGSETVIGEQGTDDGQFTTLGFGSLAIAPDGTIHVVDNGNFRIQSFDPDGAFLTSFGSEGDGDGQFTRAIGIAVDGDGQVYVTDDGRPEVQVFTADGTFVRSFGTGGEEPGQFLHPTGIDVAPGGQVWVADYEAQRVQLFSADGEFVAEYASPGAAGSSATLEGIEVTEDGGVLVTSYRGGEVLAVPGQGADPEADWPIVAGQTGTGDGQFSAPVDLALAPDGSLVVTDQRTNTVQVFVPAS